MMFNITNMGISKEKIPLISEFFPYIELLNEKKDDPVIKEMTKRLLYDNPKNALPHYGDLVAYQKGIDGAKGAISPEKISQFRLCYLVTQLLSRDLKSPDERIETICWMQSILVDSAPDSKETLPDNHFTNDELKNNLYEAVKNRMAQAKTAYQKVRLELIQILDVALNRTCQENHLPLPNSIAGGGASAGDEPEPHQQPPLDSEAGGGASAGDEPEPQQQPPLDSEAAGGASAGDEPEPQKQPFLGSDVIIATVGVLAVSAVVGYFLAPALLGGLSIAAGSAIIGGGVALLLGAVSLIGAYFTKSSESLPAANVLPEGSVLNSTKGILDGLKFTAENSPPVTPRSAPSPDSQRFDQKDESHQAPSAEAAAETEKKKSSSFSNNNDEKPVSFSISIPRKLLRTGEIRSELHSEECAAHHRIA